MMIGLGCPWRRARQSGQVLESESVGATCSHPVVFSVCDWRLRCISDPPSRKQQVHAIDSGSVKEHVISFFFLSILFLQRPLAINADINKQMNNPQKINFNGAC